MEKTRRDYDQRAAFASERGRNCRGAINDDKSEAATQKRCLLEIEISGA